MKKTLVTLLAVMTMGVCCSSALASDVSVKVGYNLAGTTEATLTGKGTEADPYKLNGGNGGGLVIGAEVSTEIAKGFGVKASFTADYMNKKFDKGGSLFIDVEKAAPEATADAATPTNLQKIQKTNATPTNLEVKKWTLSGDALVTYNFVKSVPGLAAGVQAGVNFVSTNMYDMMVPFLKGDSKTDQDTLDNMKDKFNVSGGAAVVGAFVNYDYNDKLSLAADGYIGLIKFGDLASAFNNYKVNASLAYKVYNNIAIKAGFTFANTTFEKTIDAVKTEDGQTSGLGASIDNIMNIDKTGKGSNTFVYSYKQIVPSIGVSYSF